MAVQCPRFRTPVPAQRTRAVDLGLRRLLEGMRVLLRLGHGRVPAAGFTGPLSEAHRQMRSLLPARMPDECRAIFTVRAAVGVAWGLVAGAPHIVGGTDPRMPGVNLYTNRRACKCVLR